MCTMRMRGLSCFNPRTISLLALYALLATYIFIFGLLLSYSSRAGLVKSEPKYHYSFQPSKSTKSTTIIISNQTTNCLNHLSNTTTIIPHLQTMCTENMPLSFRQQARFFSVQNEVLDLLRSSPQGMSTLMHDHELDTRYFAIPLNQRYAFRHIFKNGGTTVRFQVDMQQPDDDEFDDDALDHDEYYATEEEIISNNQALIATVRDPIDHFLSGWSECGKRKPYYFNKTLNDTYDSRIGGWLSLVESDPCSWNTSICICRRHSLPQAKFLLTRQRHEQQQQQQQQQQQSLFHSLLLPSPGNNMTIIDPKIEIIGHMNELPKLLTTLANFTFNPMIYNGRVASEDATKAKYFPKRKELLSDTTILRLCDFLALDYYFFDFEPPAICHAVSEIRNSFKALIPPLTPPQGRK